MEFSTDWIETGPNASLEERSTLCDLRIFVAGENACHFSAPEAGRTFDCVTVPAVHLAEGLATDWWSIFGGRDREYPIRRYRTGFALPDLVFRCDGSTFEARGNQLHCDNPKLRFWQVEKEDISRTEAEAALADFIGNVVERLRGNGLENSEPALRWLRISESLSDPDETAFCEAAGALGADPYTIADETAHLIERAGELFAEEALIEFLAGLGKTEQPASILDWVRQVESRPQRASCLPDLPAVAEEIDSVVRSKPGERGWAAGYRAARALRTALDLPAHRGMTPEKFGRATGRRRFRTGSQCKRHPCLGFPEQQRNPYSPARSRRRRLGPEIGKLRLRAGSRRRHLLTGWRAFRNKRSSPCRTPSDRPGVFRRIPCACRKCPGHARRWPRRR